MPAQPAERGRVPENACQGLSTSRQLILRVFATDLPGNDLSRGPLKDTPLAPARIIARLALLMLMFSGGTAGAVDAVSDREVRCLAMIAYAEAAVDGLPGMTAVMRVVRNRMVDSRFPDDACAVIAQSGQFQPVTESTVLRRVAQDPEGYSIPQVLGVHSPAARRLLATAHRLARAALTRPDPTGGALYFVNPVLMDPARCSWFAALKRTAQIGSHVFMTHYREGELPRPPSIDCETAGKGRVASLDVKRARSLSAAFGGIFRRA
jgi:hypothetical protein